jgi:hypothetical protein
MSAQDRAIKRHLHQMKQQALVRELYGHEARMRNRARTLAGKLGPSVPYGPPSIRTPESVREAWDGAEVATGEFATDGQPYWPE